MPGVFQSSRGSHGERFVYPFPHAGRVVFEARASLNRANSSFCSGLRISLGRSDLPAMIQHSGKQIYMEMF